MTFAGNIYLDSTHKIRFDSSVNRGSDYGEIVYEHDYDAYAYWGDTNENSQLIIRVQNDGRDHCSDVIQLESPQAVIVNSPELRTLNDLIVNGNTNINGSTTINNTLTVSGQTTINSTLNVTGNITGSLTGN